MKSHERSFSGDKKPLTRRFRRFYILHPLTDGKGPVHLDASETHHLRHLIRLAPGDRCLVTDGRGWEAEASVREFAKDGTATLDILEITKRTEARANKVLLRVMPALLQKGKNDHLMEKAQELGVDELWPITSGRCQINIAEEKTGKTVERWKKIAAEASKQSGSLSRVRIEPPRPFKDAVQALALDDALVMFHPDPDAVPFAKWLEQFRAADQVKSLNLFIGPEGGFTEDEVEWVKSLRKKNTWIVGLGEVVLKADTAFIGIVAALRFSGILS